MFYGNLFGCNIMGAHLKSIMTSKADLFFVIKMSSYKYSLTQPNKSGAQREPHYIRCWSNLMSVFSVTYHFIKLNCNKRVKK